MTDVNKPGIGGALTGGVDIGWRDPKIGRNQFFMVLFVGTVLQLPGMP